ncbi:MAG: helix-turn-helix transcriptional regulator [Burkholderiaceae bacterium]|nr:helix-turn-helix transcriptional regulator [Burkholderiaceae bacterium]
MAKLTGLHFNTVGRIERGQSEANAEQVLRLARVLGVPPVSLSLYGGQPVVSTDGDDFVLIDIVDVEVSAGGGSLNGHHEVLGRLAFARSWLQQRKLTPENARVITARGKSMADRINHGDILLVDTSINTLKEDGVYVIERDGLDYVKLLQRDFSTGGLHIISYNPDFKPQFLTAEQSNEMRICGRVVWHGGEL